MDVLNSHKEIINNKVIYNNNHVALFMKTGMRSSKDEVVNRVKKLLSQDFLEQSLKVQIYSKVTKDYSKIIEVHNKRNNQEKIITELTKKEIERAEKILTPKQRFQRETYYIFKSKFSNKKRTIQKLIEIEHKINLNDKLNVTSANKQEIIDLIGRHITQSGKISFSKPEGDKIRVFSTEETKDFVKINGRSIKMTTLTSNLNFVESLEYLCKVWDYNFEHNIIVNAIKSKKGFSYEINILIKEDYIQGIEPNLNRFLELSKKTKGLINFNFKNDLNKYLELTPGNSINKTA